MLPRRSFQKCSISTSRGAVLIFSHFLAMKEAMSSHWAYLSLVLSDPDRLGLKFYDYCIVVWYIRNHVGWYHRTRAVSHDRVKSVRHAVVGSVICCFRQWLAVMSFSLVWCSGSLHPGFNIGVPVDWSQSRRLKLSPSMTRWLVKSLAREDASSSRIMLVSQGWPTTSQRIRPWNWLWGTIVQDEHPRL